MRPLYLIAKEIRQDWKKVSPHAEPYLSAMNYLESPRQNYILDSGYSIIAYFLSNATGWRGETARKIKAELKALLKEQK